MIGGYEELAEKVYREYGFKKERDIYFAKDPASSPPDVSCYDKFITSCMTCNCINIKACGEGAQAYGFTSDTDFVLAVRYSLYIYCIHLFLFYLSRCFFYVYLQSSHDMT